MNWFDSAKELIAKWKTKHEGIQLNEPDFTPRCRRVLGLAGQEAERLRHSYTGTAHLLLGLIGLGSGVACNILLKQGFTLESVREAIEAKTGKGFDTPPYSHPYTPRAKRVMKLAEQEAKAIRHTYTGTEHLLLALLNEREGLAAQIFQSLDLDVEEMRRDILREVDPPRDEQPKGSA